MVYFYEWVFYYGYMVKKAKKRQPRGRARLLFIASAVGIAAVALFVLGVFKLPQPCANSISCIKDLSGMYQPQNEGVFMGQKVKTPPFIAGKIVSNQVLGGSTLQKHIFVDLTNQKVSAYEGEKKVYEFRVSTGKWAPTPTGDYRIWIKLKYTRMSGGTGADYYNLPNVPYVMFFYNNEVPKARGFSLHGAYWHNNFGYPMSHGCVNMRPEDAAKIYAWASPTTDGNITYATEKDQGTLITIFGQPPI